MTDEARDWKIFLGDGSQHDGLADLPPPPPWRFPRSRGQLKRPADLPIDSEAERAAPFLSNEPMVLAVNAALYLRRPLLVTGPPGTGKSTLIAKVAHELKLGPVLRWPISSRSTVRGGVYEYDAVGRLQASKEGDPPVEQYLNLGPLGTALAAQTWPRALLIDEIDKSDLDFANDLLNVIEEGAYEIPELYRLGREGDVIVRDHDRRDVAVRNGVLVCGQFPFLVMTSNGEREFPPPFLRRCVRLTITPPGKKVLAEIVRSHLRHRTEVLDEKAVEALIGDFLKKREDGGDLAVDQLLNAVFLTVAMPAADRTFAETELESLRRDLLRHLSGPEA